MRILDHSPLGWLREGIIFLASAWVVMVLRLVFARHDAVLKLIADDCPICHVPHAHGCPIAEAEAVLQAYQTAHPID